MKEQLLFSADDSSFLKRVLRQKGNNNAVWRICGSSGRRGWPLFWSASGSSGPVLPAEASSVYTQVRAAIVAGSTPVQSSTDAKRKIRMQEITFAKGNEQHLKDCKGMRWLYIYHSQRSVSQFSIPAHHRREGRIQKQEDRQGFVGLF